ncbi:GNAT family N-acetyltransferase [bacterium]|nr:GNAT family N-acetyltransferase [bacterium]
MLQRLGDKERALLAPLRAEIWRGEISVAQFEERNRRYYEHPFGQKRMQTWGWFEKGELVTSLDAVSVPFLEHQSGRAHAVDGWHLASILTPLEYRGRGYASRMIDAFLQAHPRICSLASGVGTAFYEKHGFRAPHSWHCEIPASSPADQAPSQEIPVGEFVGEMREHRRRQVARRPDSAALLPDAVWWDWLGLIYAYYCETRGLQVPRGRFLRTELESGPVWLAALEHAPNKTLDIWWASDSSPALSKHFAGWAAELGMEKAAWMAAEKNAWTVKPAYPMLRPVNAVGPRLLLDCQLGDCW